MTKQEHIIRSHRWSGTCETFPNCDLLRDDLQHESKGTAELRRRGFKRQNDPRRAPTPRERADLLVASSPTFAGARDSYKVDEITQVIEAAVADERERCANIAATFTIDPDTRIHPDIPLHKMNESAKTAAHMTAQNIAMAIRERR